MTNGLSPAQRQLYILEWLQEQGSLTVEQLAGRFGVSAMTIHRDLHQLAAEGRVRKVRGGVVPVPAPAESAGARPRCVMCGKRASPRTAWVVTSTNGEQRHACCSHCGLLHLRHAAAVQSALAADFLYGRMVNVYQAYFVVGSDVTLCCMPSVLCLATRQEAERFRQGFGGIVMDFFEATAALGQAHLPASGPLDHPAA